MTNGSDTRWKCITFLAVILATAGATVLPSFGEEILLHTQQPYSISDNRTLVVEDVDTSAGIVWLKLYSRNETLKSALLRVGDHFGYDHTNLTVDKIYAGGERDLVEIVLNNSSAVYRSENPISAKVSANTSKNISRNLTLNKSSPLRIPKRSPGFEALAIPMIVLVYRLINVGRFRN
jgi:hypothetical protein